MPLRPLHDYILIKPLEEEEEHWGGIIIPDTAREKPQHGVVINVGQGRWQKDGSLLPLAVSPGDRVVFGKYAGTEVTIDGEQMLILRESDLLGIRQPGGGGERP